MKANRLVRCLMALVCAAGAGGCAGLGDGTFLGDSRSAEAVIADRLLLEAADQGRLEHAMFALELGADVDATERNLDRTPLMLASDHGFEPIVQLLLAMGAHADTQSEEGWTALMYAVNGGQAAIVRQLLASGADPEATDPQSGFSALMLASLLGDVDTIAALAGAGADVTRRAGDEGDTPLVLAAANAGTRAPLAVAELLVRGAEIETPNDGGVTPLIAAVLAANLDTVRLLLDEGAAPDRQSDEGHTPLGLACLAGNPALVEALLLAGADPDRRSAGGVAPLLLAASGGHREVAALLVDAGAGVDSVDPIQGRTALMLAAGRGDAEMVDLLLHLGADAGLAGADGMTARAIAQRQGYRDVLRLLDGSGSAQL
ncbi:MAG: ankyrin repeat domain-containing protein [Rhodospirillaceae bacterium]|nr:ankyrin repeat domain-containing protein [Rhodospirillaceae bacterium]